MHFKRNFFGYLLWMIAAVTIVIAAISRVCRFYDDNLYGLLGLPEGVDSAFAQYGSGILFVAVCIGIFFAGSGISSLVRRLGIGEKALNVIRGITIVLVFILAAAYRLYLILMVPADTVCDTAVYRAALVTGEGIPVSFAGSQHGATYVFTVLLHGIMTFFGNSVMSVCILQFMIQMLTIVLVYFAASRLTGYSAGLVAAVILTVLPAYTDKMTEAGPGTLTALFVTLGIFFVSMIFKMENDGSKIAFAIFAGLLSGCMVYLDGLCLAPAVLLICAFVFELTHDDEYDGDINPAVIYGINVLAAAAGFGLALLTEWICTGTTPDVAVKIWFDLNYSAAFPKLVSSVLNYDFTTQIQLVIMLGLYLFIIPGFFKHRSQPYIPILFMLILALTPFETTGYLGDYSCAIVLSAIIAGSGLQSMIIPKDKTDSEVSSAFEHIEKTEEMEKDGKLRKDKASAESARGEAHAEEGTAPDADQQKTQSVPFDEEASIKEDEKNMMIHTITRAIQVDDMPGMIHNPLKLPPKRVHEAMEYRVDVADDDMHFDVDVSEDDDFDI